jgi:hypothetical protein
MYIDEQGATRLKNGSVTRQGLISSFDDIKEIQEDIDNKPQISNAVIVSYQLISINKDAHI